MNKWISTFIMACKHFPCFNRGGCTERVNTEGNLKMFCDYTNCTKFEGDRCQTPVPSKKLESLYGTLLM